MSDRDVPLVKINRVRSVAEAKQYEALGADIIGVALRPEQGGRLFDDDRGLSEDAVEEIAGGLTRAQLALALPDEPDRYPTLFALARRLRVHASCSRNLLRRRS